MYVSVYTYVYTCLELAVHALGGFSRRYSLRGISLAAAASFAASASALALGTKQTSSVAPVCAGRRYYYTPCLSQ